jgi:hypothetical protein
MALAPNPEAAKPKALIPDLSARLDGWAQAWATKDLDSYFDFYASSFRPAGAMNRDEWKKSRQSRIVAAGPIAIEITDVTTRPLADGSIETRFTQRYVSARLKQASRKTLVWCLMPADGASPAKCPRPCARGWGLVLSRSLIRNSIPYYGKMRLRTKNPAKRVALHHSFRSNTVCALHQRRIKCNASGFEMHDQPFIGD